MSNINNDENKIIFVDKVAKLIYEKLISFILYSKSFESYKREYIENNKQLTEPEILDSNDFIIFTYVIMSIKTDFNSEFSYNRYKGLYSRLLNAIYRHVLTYYEIPNNNENIINDNLIKAIIDEIKTIYIISKEKELRKKIYIQIKKIIKSFNSEIIKREIDEKIKEIYQDMNFI